MAVPSSTSGRPRAWCTASPARRLAAGAHRLVLKLADRAGNAARLAWDVTVAEGPGATAGSAPAGGGSATGGRSEPHPDLPAQWRASAPQPPSGPSPRASERRDTAPSSSGCAPGRTSASPCACTAAMRCGSCTVRAGAHGIATVRVACPGVATCAARRGTAQAARSHRRSPPSAPAACVRPQSRSAPTVARVSGKLAELRGHHLVLEALTPGGWRRVGRVLADSKGRFATSFAIVHPGEFALRGRAPRARRRCQPAVRADGALTSEDA